MIHPPCPNNKPPTSPPHALRQLRNQDQRPPSTPPHSAPTPPSQTPENVPFDPSPSTPFPPPPSYSQTQTAQSPDQANLHQCESSFSCHTEYGISVPKSRTNHKIRPNQSPTAVVHPSLTASEGPQLLRKRSRPRNSKRRASLEKPVRSGRPPQPPSLGCGWSWDGSVTHHERNPPGDESSPCVNTSSSTPCETRETIERSALVKTPRIPPTPKQPP